MLLLVIRPYLSMYLCREENMETNLCKENTHITGRRYRQINFATITVKYCYHYEAFLCIYSIVLSLEQQYTI